MDENILKYLEEKAKDVNLEIEKVVARRVDDKWVKTVFGKMNYACDKKALQGVLVEPIYDLLDRGGKRWRPALMLLCIEAVGGEKRDFLRFAALPEIIHNGTLAVDDIEDDSDIRRGEKCSHRKYGVDIAINMGNAMYFLPLQLLYNNPAELSAEMRLAIYDLFAKEMVRVHAGQGMDIYWHRGQSTKISEQNYLQMCAFKTGTLARLSAKLGVILGKGTAEQEEALGYFAETIGVAFQIQDDILNLTGEKFSKQKGLGEDIHEGKRTLMLLHALEHLEPVQKERLIAIVNSHPTDEKTIGEAIELIRSTGAIEYAKNKAVELVNEAWQKTEGVLPSGPAKQKLAEVTSFLVEREI